MDRWKGTDACKIDIQAVESRRLGEGLDMGVRAGGKHRLRMMPRGQAWVTG